MKVRFSPTARQQIDLFAAWWNEHRRDARVRVEDALEAAVAVIAEHPDIGRTLRGGSQVQDMAAQGHALPPVLQA